MSDDSDIRNHLPRLTALASQCRSVVEFGVRFGHSTRALVASGVPVHSYDIDNVAPVTDAPNWTFTVGDSLKVDIEPADMLFIDSFHTYAHLLGELRRHGSKISKFITMHDTEIFGHTGQDGTRPGLQVAIIDWLKESPDWFTLAHYTDSFGMTVLARK